MLFSPRGDYKNFRYRVELKINDHGNSGMHIRTPEEATFTKGYEIQVKSTHGDPIKTGSLYSYVHIFKHLAPPTPGSPRRSRRWTRPTEARQ
jgi:hypothetical protein